MRTISNILVVIAPCASDQPSLRKAMHMAVSCGASVELLLCDTRVSSDERLFQNVPIAFDVTERNLNHWLESLAQPLRDASLEVSTAVVRGDALHEAILKWLENSPADLVVKDTHHHSLARRTFLSNTDWDLIRKCRQALLLTKAAYWRSPPCVGAAVDPTHSKDPSSCLDKAIIEATAALRLGLKARVEVFNAYFPALLPAAVDARAPLPLPVTNEALEAERTLHLNAVEALLRGFTIPSECQHVSMGVPSEYLPRMAEQYCVDIMVMGALSRSRLKQRLLGSTAERLLEHLPCDILTVKPTDWSECLPF